MSIPVDFKGVESGGGRVRVPEGDYRAKVVGYKVGESKSSGNEMVTWTWEGTKGKLKGKKLKDYTTLTKESLWKLMSVLEALGFEVANKKIDLEKYLKRSVGMECGITVIDEEYDNKISSKITDYLTLEDLEGTQDDDGDDDDETSEEEEDSEEIDEDDELPSPKQKGKKKGKKNSKKMDEQDEIEDLDLDDI